MPYMDELPDWEPGTVCVLSTGGGAPHAIPVSTAVRAGRRRVLLALAARRETLARLRREPRCALTIVTTGDIACTVHARAEIVQESLRGAEGVAAVALEVESIQDHMQPRFAIAAGVAWDWTDEDARASDAAVRGALDELARR
jgi:Pyridoxamine 5'-phosphate oxidase